MIPSMKKKGILKRKNEKPAHNTLTQQNFGVCKVTSKSGNKRTRKANLTKKMALVRQELKHGRGQ